jgi:lipopolysaccharide export system permease protein
VTLFRYAAVRALAAALVALAGVVAIFLAIDFVDHAVVFTGPGWALAALELYANKAAGLVYQLGPAATILGAAVATSTFRQTSEYTAMRALGLGPSRLAVPAVAVALALGAGLMVLQDVVGVRAADRAEEIKATRFGRGGDLSRYRAAREPKRWFRSEDGSRIYYLRGELPGGGFEHATVLDVGPDSTVSRRIDAARMRPEADAWVLEDVTDRTFAPDGTMHLDRAAKRRYRFGEPPGAFSLVSGRPSQMRWSTLASQIEARRRLGQRTAEFELEAHNRVAYPLAAVPGALLAVAVALRARRRGHVATSLLEAVGISMLFWAAQGVAWALGLSGRVPAWLAAWAPNALFVIAGVAAVRRAR